MSLPPLWTFEPITVERGVTHDPEFEAWANLVYHTDGDAAISIKDFSKATNLSLDEVRVLTASVTGWQHRLPFIGVSGLAVPPGGLS